MAGVGNFELRYRATWQQQQATHQKKNNELSLENLRRQQGNLMERKTSAKSTKQRSDGINERIRKEQICSFLKFVHCVT